jgi:hypothetical protein
MLIKNAFGGAWLAANGNTTDRAAVDETTADARVRAGTGAAMTGRRDDGKMSA